ncbi:MAG TPA: rRNA maturation RNAse YbeY [Phycisphaerae bacterium]|nr:rRNA maturation RNAse YbeY [Phycisphaerae bacterium]
MALYVVHGILHLAGYDDHTARDFERMHAREDQLLERLGLGPVFGLLR